MKIQLSKLVSTFEDGVSLSNYQAIARLIKRHGMLASIDLEALTHEALTTALRLAERGNQGNGPYIFSC